MRILYFAWLRAKTGTASEDVSPPPEVNTVGALMEWLAASRPGFAEALAMPRAWCARRSTRTTRNRPIRYGPATRSPSSRR